MQGEINNERFFCQSVWMTVRKLKRDFAEWWTAADFGRPLCSSC